MSDVRRQMSNVGFLLIIMFLRKKLSKSCNKGRNLFFISNAGKNRTFDIRHL